MELLIAYLIIFLMIGIVIMAVMVIHYIMLIGSHFHIRETGEFGSSGFGIKSYYSGDFGNGW